MKQKTGPLGRDGASQPITNPCKATDVGFSGLQCFLGDDKDLSRGVSVFGCQPHDGGGQEGVSLMETTGPNPSCKDSIPGPGKEAHVPEHSSPQRVHPRGHSLPAPARLWTQGAFLEEARSTSFHVSTWEGPRHPLPGGRREGAEQAEGTGGGTKGGDLRPSSHPRGSEHGCHPEIKSPSFKKKTNKTHKPYTSGQRKRRAFKLEALLPRTK